MYYVVAQYWNKTRESLDMIQSNQNKIVLIDMLIIIDLERHHTQPCSEEIIDRSWYWAFIHFVCLIKTKGNYQAWHDDDDGCHDKRVF